jgi:hypothetical protein
MCSNLGSGDGYASTGDKGGSSTFITISSILLENKNYFSGTVRNFADFEIGRRMAILATWAAK